MTYLAATPRDPSACSSTGIREAFLFGRDLGTKDRNRRTLLSLGALPADGRSEPPGRPQGDRAGEPGQRVRPVLPPGRARSGRRCRCLRAAVRGDPEQLARPAHHRLHHLVEPQGGHPVAGAARRHALVSRAPTKGSRHPTMSSTPMPARTSTFCRCSTGRCRARRTRLSDRVELHLGLGDEPPRARRSRSRPAARSWASAICRSATTDVARIDRRDPRALRPDFVLN